VCCVLTDHCIAAEVVLDRHGAGGTFFNTEGGEFGSLLLGRDDEFGGAHGFSVPWSLAGGALTGGTVGACDGEADEAFSFDMAAFDGEVKTAFCVQAGDIIRRGREKPLEHQIPGTS